MTVGTYVDKGDAHLAFEGPIVALNTPAAEAAVPTALEAVFARCGSAQMFTPPPPPDFRRQPVAGPLSFASNPLASAASPHARSTRRFRTAHPTPLGSGQASCRPTSPVRRLSYQPSLPATPPLGARPWVPHLVHRRRLTPATPLDGGPATATHNTHKEEKP